MAYTFLSANECSDDFSTLIEDEFRLAKELIRKAKQNNVKLVLPIDYVIEKKQTIKSTGKQIVKSNANERIGLDIGPETIKLFVNALEKAGTIIWNGPMGIYENPEYATGTNEIIKAMADSNKLTVIGGGDTAAAVEKIGVWEEISHISTGGGAFIQFLGNNMLPGINAVLNSLI